MNELEYAHFKKICQDQKLKVTNQRYSIYKVLAASKKHPTADQIYDFIAPDLPGLSRDTVYRTLNTLVENNIVRKLIIPGGAAHFDCPEIPHHHFYCSSCSSIIDISWPELSVPYWPPSVMQVGLPKKIEVLITGLCHHCAAKI